MRLVPMVTLPDASPELGLDAFAARNYDDVLTALTEADEYDFSNGEDWRAGR